MKNILSLFLSLCLILGLAACGQAPQTPDARAVGSAVSALLSTAQTASEPAESLSSESPSAESSSTDSKPTAGTPSAPSAPVSSAASASASGPSSVTVPASSAMSVASSASVPESKPAIPEWEKAYDLSNYQGNGTNSFLNYDQWVACLTSDEPDPYVKKLVGNVRYRARQSLARQGIDKPYLLAPRTVAEPWMPYGAEIWPTYVCYNLIQEADQPSDRQLMCISVEPQTEEMEKAALLDLYTPRHDRGEKKQGEYKGIVYGYIDGDAETQSTAAAWYRQDGLLVRIIIFWAKAQEPWDPAYFDAFTFEKVAF